MSAKSEETVEVVVVGAPGVGKSCVSVRFLKDEFSAEYDPTVEESYRKVVNVDEKFCQLSIIDTAGQHEYATLRDQHLSSGNGFLLVFSLNDKNSLKEVEELKQAILQVKDKKRVPMVLVGNKCDLEHEVTKEEIMQVCGKLTYVEASAKSNVNIQESFQEVIRQVRKMQPAKEGRKECCVVQ